MIYQLDIFPGQRKVPRRYQEGNALKYQHCTVLYHYRVQCLQVVDTAIANL
uniref:Uncharacterized protein n=1 Tax=Octopus bimaculoides TaxID=37653 RepID=A0A0L8GSU6_OCTBM